MNFLGFLGEELSPYPLSQLWTWFLLGADFLRLVSGENMNMTADFYWWSQVFLNSLHWWGEGGGCFEIGYHFHKNLKYWNTWHRFSKNLKHWSKIIESIISSYLIHIYVWKKRHFENVGGEINLSDKQTQIAAYSFPDLT